jgi:putative transposon-encoded protein
MRLENPWPDGYTINPGSRYGPRKSPITGRTKMHHGVDVAGKFPVTVPAKGVVTHIGWSPTGGGHTVLISHGSIVTVYYHGFSATTLLVGQHVEVGDYIYRSGTTGASTGNHLHFEVRVGPAGNWGDTMNPEDYLGKQETDTVLKITGKLDKATWTALQTALKGHKLYTGLIDGIPGRLTYTALQRWSDAPETGKLDVATRKAVQKRIGVKVDGIWGTGTISELQGELIRGLAGVRKPEPVKVETVIERVVKPMSEGLRKFFRKKENLR